MRPAVVFGTNLVVGAGLLVWVLHRFGGPALAVLGEQPSLPRLAAFGFVVAAVIAAFTWRWRIVLAGLGPPPGLRALAMYRTAGQSVAALVPSAKIGGDPLRAWLTVRSRVPPASAIAGVAVDRALEMGAAAPFTVIFASVLVQSGVPALQGALVTVSIAMAALAVGIALTVRWLRRGGGLVTALARGARLDRLRLVQGQMHVMAASEAAAAELAAQPRRMLGAFLAGLGANLLVLLEYTLLLSAFGLPSDPLAVVAAIFATGASHLLPVPAGLGVLEGGQMWLFGVLGYPADVGLAVGLAVRLRELVWLLPGVLYLVGRGVRSSLAGLRTA